VLSLTFVEDVREGINLPPTACWPFHVFLAKYKTTNFKRQLFLIVAGDFNFLHSGSLKIYKQPETRVEFQERNKSGDFYASFRRVHNTFFGIFITDTMFFVTEKEITSLFCVH